MFATLVISKPSRIALSTSNDSTLQSSVFIRGDLKSPQAAWNVNSRLQITPDEDTRMERQRHFCFSLSLDYVFLLLFPVKIWACLEIVYFDNVPVIGSKYHHYNSMSCFLLNNSYLAIIIRSGFPLIFRQKLFAGKGF